MSWVDLGIVSIILISGIIGLLRGFVREIMSLVVWTAAFTIAYKLSGSFAHYFAFASDNRSVQSSISFTVLFLGTFLVGAIANFIIGRAVSGTGLSSVNRGIGFLFGTARGVLLVSSVVFVLAMLSMQKTTWWKQSALLPAFQKIATWGQQHVQSYMDHRLQDQDKKDDSSKDNNE